MDVRIKILLGSWGLPMMVILMIGLIVYSEILPPELMLPVGGVIILVLLVLFFRHLRKRLAHRKKVQILRQKQTDESLRHPISLDGNQILYLRPFKIDNRYMSPMEYAGELYSSFESLLCRFVSDVGKPIAIGRPGETQQPLGASRVYATDDTWKQRVSQLFRLSEYVILYVDFTPGVLWEIDNALRNYNEKLILLPKIYNRTDSSTVHFLLRELLTLLYPLYLLWSNCFFFTRAHRGAGYYRQWNRVIGPYLGDVKIDDRVSAIIFENGKAIPFYAEKPAPEAQMDAVATAIRVKLRQAAPPPCRKRQAEQPLLRVDCTLSHNPMIHNLIAPGQGYVEFYEYGFSFRKNPLIMERVRTNSSRDFRAYYGKDNLLPYAGIRKIQREKPGCLRILMDQTNGSICLNLPDFDPWLTERVAAFLTDAWRRCRVTAEARPLIEEIRQREQELEDSYAIAFLAHLLLNGPVWLLLAMLLPHPYGIYTLCMTPYCCLVWGFILQSLAYRSGRKWLQTLGWICVAVGVVLFTLGSLLLGIF